MLTVNPVNLQNTSFKANSDKACETHSALKTRGIGAAIAGIPILCGFSFADTF